jgi:hypothetical protein
VGIKPEWAEAFFARYDRQGWVFGNGQPIRNLRSALAHYKIEQQAREAEAAKKDGITDRNETPQQVLERVRRTGG